MDRCFTITRYPVENKKELVLINNHMSAYNEGGIIRARQLKLLNKTMEEEYKKGNYVIVGGDFNHALGGTVDVFTSKQKIPNWVFELNDEDFMYSDHNPVKLTFKLK